MFRKVINSYSRRVSLLKLNWLSWNTVTLQGETAWWNTGKHYRVTCSASVTAEVENSCWSYTIRLSTSTSIFSRHYHSHDWLDQSLPWLFRNWLVWTDFWLTTRCDWRKQYLLTWLGSTPARPDSLPVWINLRSMTRVPICTTIHQNDQDLYHEDQNLH